MISLKGLITERGVSLLFLAISRIRQTLGMTRHVTPSSCVWRPRLIRYMGKLGFKINRLSTCAHEHIGFVSCNLQFTVVNADSKDVCCEAGALSRSRRAMGQRPLLILVKSALARRVCKWLLNSGPPLWGVTARVYIRFWGIAALTLSTVLYI